MKAVLCWLALGAIPALGQPGGGSIAPFAIYTQFEHAPPGPVLDSLKAELDSILGEAGLDLQWRGWESNVGEVSHGLAVVQFKGRCDITGLIHDRAEIGPLGWTYVVDGDVLPFSDVDCDRVRGFLSKSLMHVQERGRDTAFGRALGRVLAHELYHIITETRHHGASGVAQATYTGSELLARDFTFAEADQKVLGEKMAALLEHLPHKGSPSTGQSLYAANGCNSCHGSQGQGTRRAPSLRAAGRLLNINTLAARLADRASKMYRHAGESKSLWLALVKPDIEDLLSYLNAPPE